MCPFTLPSLPIFANGWPGEVAATALIGDELVVWGRFDSPPFPSCPPGAPCARFRKSFTSVDEGAILEP